MNKKLGYYSVGSTIFESKIEACTFATKIYNTNPSINPLKLIRWNFNDEIFDSYDWSKEPSESLDYLYNMRAKSLRERYDYLIISYSGGADSHNLLMSFLRQGLFIDEIIVTHMNKAMSSYANISILDKSPQYAYASEYALQTVQRLKDIVLLSNRTKIRVFDMSDSIFSTFSKSADESWVYKVREELNPIDASRYNYLQFSSFKKQLDLDKKIAIVLGVDKPIVKIDEKTNRFYICFKDRLANITPIGEYTKDYTNTTIEYFYWSPDCCNLLCKQAHTLANWLNKNKDFRKFFLPYSITVSGRSITERIIRPILYTTWNPHWFQANKGVNDWHSTFDLWFIDQYKNTLEHSLWKKGLKHVTDSCKPFILNRKNPDGLISFNKRYFFANVLS